MAVEQGNHDGLSTVEGGMRRPPLLAASLLLLTVAAYGCGIGSSKEDASPTSSTALAPKVPPLLDPQSLVEDSGCGVELPQLVGLTREEARTWADRSGFISFNNAGTPRTEECRPTTVTVSLVDGRVSGARTG